MNVFQIDKLNILLIIVSAILAYLFPLELFIFSFSILGPLHYLTEINWLSHKKYFTKKNNFFWLIISMLSTVLIVAPKIYFSFFNITDSILSDSFMFINEWSNSVIFCCIILAIIIQFKLKRRTKYILLSVSICTAVLLNDVEYYTVVIGLLVPTVMHVYIFTLFFMLYGAKKSKSIYGYIAVLVALLIPLIFVFIEIDPEKYLFSNSLKAIYIDNNLHVTPVLFAKFLGISDGNTFFFYEILELRLMMFMSFIYLYHYLNWFSKTTTIAWHKNITIKGSLFIGLSWCVMLLLFYVNFEIGFVVAVFFSFLHVILEFPLNVISIKELFIK